MGEMSGAEDGCDKSSSERARFLLSVSVFGVCMGGMRGTSDVGTSRMHGVLNNLNSPKIDHSPMPKIAKFKRMLRVLAQATPELGNA